MENKVLRYRNGDQMAKDELIADIMKLHNYQINKTEATILLYKKYGTYSSF